MMPRFSGLLALLAMLALTAPSGTAAAQDWDQCPSVIPDFEQEHGIPVDLLTAISLVESGRWNEDEKALMAWPWAVMAEGRGRYLPSKEAAVREVRRLQARGVSNIDVGCMQVNLHYHPDAFDSLEDAFEPRSNAAYAAQFLKDLYHRHRSWSKAVGYYHSGDRTFNYPYRKKVMATWREQVRNARDRPRPSRATEEASARVASAAATRQAQTEERALIDADEMAATPSREQERAASVDQVRRRHEQLRKLHDAGMRQLDAMAERSRRQSEAFRRYMDSLSYQ